MDGPKFLEHFLFAATVAWTLSRSMGRQSLRQGSFLKVEEESDLLVSPNGTFSSGFYEVGTNASCYSIWYTHTINKTVVWMANRDTPVSKKRSKLALHRNGNLVLTNGVGSTVWSTNTFSNGSMKVQLQLLETGNLQLVLIDQEMRVIWQSFDSPTNTLLPSQRFGKSNTLVSMRSRGTYLSGFYNFKYDGNNVLYLTHDGPQLSSVYWPKMDTSVFISGRSPYNSSRIAVLNALGKFRSSDNLKFSASDYGFGPKRRLTLDYDGILRLYSLDESTGMWNVTWLPDIDVCRVHGLCGEYGICTYKPQPICTCPYGFIINDPSDWSKGCSPPSNLTHNSKELDFMKLPYTDYYGSDLDTYHLKISFEECRNVCLNDSRCKGFGFALDGWGQCYPKNFLFNGFCVPSTPSVIYIKILKGSVSAHEDFQLETHELNCSRAEIAHQSSGREVKRSNQYMKYLIGFVSSFAVFEVICVGLTCLFLFRKNGVAGYVNVGYMELAMEIKRFTYAELKRATKYFTEEIGKGGFGAVYKGVLDDGRVVAVKRLEGILQGDAEFWAEVNVIGTINHRNLVKLWGFCAENEHKMLVYEFLENGSLDKILFSDVELGLEQRYNIALGTAKGLSYLHEECLEWVLHCDVKPQNILLDDHFEPKVADFGMSKLFKDNHDDIGFSRVRGTRGYMAPEWMLNLKIDAKVDVYSYGIVLLELLTGKSASSLLSPEASPLSMFKEHNHVVQFVVEKFSREGLEDVIDPRLLLQEYSSEKQLERLMYVAHLCVNEDRNARPAMSKVVELLNQNDE